jgi:hypothetical protein
MTHSRASCTYCTKTSPRKIPSTFSERDLLSDEKAPSLPVARQANYSELANKWRCSFAQGKIPTQNGMIVLGSRPISARWPRVNVGDFIRDRTQGDGNENTISQNDARCCRR